MRESKLFWATLLAAIPLFMVEARPVLAETEKENIKFTIPSTWTHGGKGPGGELSFVTSKDPTRGLKGYIRSFYAPQQTAREWAIDEAKQLESQGLQIVAQPTERQAGNSTWVGLVWEQTMPVGGTTLLMRGEQYYLKGKQAMIEIFLAGPKDLFEHLDRREIDEFFSSAGFDTRSLEEAKRTAEAEYIAEMATSMERFAQPKKGEVVKGFLSVRQGVKIPLQGDLIGGMNMPVYTSVRTLINGKTVFAGLLPRELNYKILKIGYAGQETAEDGTMGSIYEVEVEAVE
jgi:hypothetical protein